MNLTENKTLSERIEKESALFAYACDPKTYTPTRREEDLKRAYMFGAECEIKRQAQEQFLEWSNRFTDTIMKLHQIGFKGYLIKDGGTIETILHDWAKREIDAINEYIESKKPF